MKLNETEQRAYNAYLDSLHDRASFYDSTFVQGLQKGREEGESIGIQKGREEGREEGEAIGIQKGKQEALKEAYDKLIASGISAEQAKSILGL